MTDHSLELTPPPNSKDRKATGSQPPRFGKAAGSPDTPKATVRSDPGTILLHWTLVIAIVTSLVTGLRLSSDAEGSWFAKLFEPILPQGEIWTWHYVSAVFVLALIFAYATYMSAARLKRRISSKKIVVLSLPASNKLRISV